MRLRHFRGSGLWLLLGELHTYPNPSTFRGYRLAWRNCRHLKGWWRRLTARRVDIVFDGPPSHKSGRFVEVEDHAGRSMRYGKWVQRDDGYWVLRKSRVDRLTMIVAALGLLMAVVYTYELALVLR